MTTWPNHHKLKQNPLSEEVVSQNCLDKTWYVINFRRACSWTTYFYQQIDVCLRQYY